MMPDDNTAQVQHLSYSDDFEQYPKIQNPLKKLDFCQLPKNDLNLRNTYPKLTRTRFYSGLKKLTFSKLKPGITTLKVSSKTSLGLQLKVLMTKMTPFGSSKAFIFSSVNYDMPHLTWLLLDWLQLNFFLGFVKLL